MGWCFRQLPLLPDSSPPYRHTSNYLHSLPLTRLTPLIADHQPCCTDAPFVGAPLNILSWPYMICLKLYSAFCSPIERGIVLREATRQARREHKQAAAQTKGAPPAHKAMHSELGAPVSIPHPLERSKTLKRVKCETAAGRAAPQGAGGGTVARAKSTKFKEIVELRGLVAKPSANSDPGDSDGLSDSGARVLLAAQDGSIISGSTVWRMLSSMLRKMRAKGTSISQFLTSVGAKKEWDANPRHQVLQRAKISKRFTEEEIVDFISQYM